MRKTTVVDKLRLQNKEFVTSEEIKRYCKEMRLDAGSVIHYLTKRKYLVRIFRGIFYVKTLEEQKLGMNKYNHLELVSKALELKGVKNWYFGMHSALKLNNMTHEYFAWEYVLSDKIFRPRPVSIAGYMFRFIKVSPKLTGFGITKEKLIRYSDPEKTFLDFAYLSRQQGREIERVVIDLSDWAEKVSVHKMRKYLTNYPRTIAEIAERVVL